MRLASALPDLVSSLVPLCLPTAEHLLPHTCPQQTACQPSSPVSGCTAGFWPLKFCLWIFALGICFAMPNNTFLGYGQVARILSGVFLIFQIIILLDLIYTSNEWLLRKVGGHLLQTACEVCTKHPLWPHDSSGLALAVRAKQLLPGQAACRVLPCSPGWAPPWEVHQMQARGCHLAHPSQQDPASAL